MVIKHYADEDINKVMIPRLYKQYQNVIEMENEKNKSVETVKDQLMRKRNIIEDLAKRLKIKEPVMGSALEDAVLGKVEEYLATLDEDEKVVDL